MTAPDSSSAEFRLCRKEPARALLFSALGLAVLLGLSWISGRVDGQLLFWSLLIFAIIYGFSRYQESQAEEDRTVKVRISREGIAIPDKFGGTMPWQAIEKISSSTHKGTTTLGLVIKRPEEHGLERQSGWSKFWLGEGVTYDITPLEGDPSEVIDAIRWYAPGALTGKL